MKRSAPMILVKAADGAALKRAERLINRVIRDKAMSKRERVAALEALGRIAHPSLSMSGCYLVGNEPPKPNWRAFLGLPKWMRGAT